MIPNYHLVTCSILGHHHQSTRQLSLTSTVTWFWIVKNRIRFLLLSVSLLGDIRLETDLLQGNLSRSQRSGGCPESLSILLLQQTIGIALLVKAMDLYVTLGWKDTPQSLGGGGASASLLQSLFTAIKGTNASALPLASFCLKVDLL